MKELLNTKHWMARTLFFSRCALQVLLILAALLVSQLVLAQTATKPTDGDGTEENPYFIRTAEELAWFRDEVNNNNNTVCAKLTGDIDMSTVCHAASDGQEELSWEPISTGNVEWKGTFDGNDKTISNLYINNRGDNLGLFGKIGAGVIKKIKVNSVNVRGGNCVGILVGYAVGATIESVYINENSAIECSGYMVGGIVGLCTGQILHCGNYHASVKGLRDVGGICGYHNGSDTPAAKIKACSNYGNVTGSTYEVGGISGKSADAVIEDCANYATVQGTYHIGGITGLIYGEKAEVKNVFTYGDVMASQDKVGLVIGAQYEKQQINMGGGQYYTDKTPEASITGLLVYNVEAMLKSNGAVVEARAIGEGAGNADMTKGYTKEQISNGYATYMLSKNAGEGVKWNQLIGANPYPAFGGFPFSICPDGVVEISCKGDVVSGKFTMVTDRPDGEFKLVHLYHTYHEKVPETCVTDGVIGYYECNDCHKKYPDEAMTEGEELSEEQLVISATGHSYGEDDACSKCQEVMPVLKLGDNTIRIDKSFDETPYTLFKFVVEKPGVLEVTGKFDASYNSVYQLALFDSEKQEVSSVTCSDNRISFTNNVEAGNCYLGLKEKDGNAVDWEQTLKLKFGELTVTLPDGMSGKGTKEEPFKIYTAEHLKWFADYVNGDDVTVPHLSACAELMADIDMSGVCHADTDETDDQNDELSWTPISPALDSYDVDYETVGWHGVFQGNGKTISNLYINYENEWSSNNVGFFGYISSGACITSLTLANAKVKNSNYAKSNGILAGRAHDASIQHVKVVGETVLEGGTDTGGIVGSIMDSRVYGCENHATIKGESYSIMGGICGYAYAPQNSGSDGSASGESRNVIHFCVNHGAVLGSYSNGTGGIAGGFEAGVMSQCANYANIQGWMFVGGIAGSISGGTIMNVFTSGNVTIDTNGSGGLVAGACSNATAERCVVYNKDAKLIVGDSEVEARAFNDDDNNFTEGAENVVAFTTEEIKSGKLTYMLNYGVMDGSQPWYQKLGEGGNAYPVIGNIEGGTVYCLKGYHCNGSLNEEYIPTYNNEGVTRYDEPHDYQERLNDEGLYAMACSKCWAYENDKRTIKNFAGEGKNLEVTEENGVYKVNQLTFTDAEPYASPVKLEVEEINYERNFVGKAGKWQALYVPFGFDCYDLSESYEVAAINNFHEYLQKDGNTNVVLEVRKLTSGTLQPLTPYLIRLKEGADATQPLFKNSKALTLLPSESRFLDCFSMTRYYKFTGVLQPKSEFTVEQDFVMGGGMLFKATSDANLSPQRWYLSATDRTSNGGSAEQLTVLKSIAIQVVGEGTTTGIEDIYVATDIEGVQSSRHGIYDLQGRKLSVEPTSGVYIKDGKKFVK